MIRWKTNLPSILGGCGSAALLTLTTHAIIPTSYPTGAGPATVQYGSDGKLVYTCEPNGDRIPDFSNCGYGGGGIAIPTNIPLAAILAPISGDNRSQIQAAINALSAQPLGPNGFRGAIVLRRGIYPFAGTLQINASGIVLRGEGSGAGGTILRRIDSNADAINIVNNPKTSRSKVPGTTHNITNSYVPVGARWFALDSASGLAVGDEIVVSRPQTEAWVDYMHMGAVTNGGTGDWQSGDASINWDRAITEIDGNRIRVDTPLTEAIERQWTTGQVYKYTWPSRLINVGIEDLRADCLTGTDDLGNTDGNFLTMTFVKNGWVRRCYNDRMRGHPMKVSSCKWVTIEDFVSYHNPLPAGHSGASIQMFTGDYADQVLYHRITASSGGFEFSAGRQCPGPIVFSESQVPKGFASSGPHMQWNNGFLWDILEMDHSIAVQLQSRGWNGGNHLAWNCETHANLNFERPPGAHLWIQGCQAPGTWSSPRAWTLPYGATNAEVLSWGVHLEPASLYRAQLAERVGPQQALAVLGRPDGANHFVLTATPEIRTVAAGQGHSFGIQMTVAPDYAGSNVTFSASGLPAGASAGFSPPSLNADGVSTLTVATTDSTPVGIYNVKVIGAGTFPKYSGGTHALAHPVFIRLSITNANDFSLSATPASQTVMAGSNVAFTVSMTVTNNFSNRVDLSVSGLPLHAAASLDPPSLTGAGTTTLSLSTSNSTPDGTYTVTIIGTSGGASSGAAVNLTVTPPPGSLPPEWTARDIGIMTNAGYGNFLNDVFTLKGSGAGITGAADQFQYVFQPWIGDAVITARLLSQSNTHAWAESGVMIRETTNTNSRFVGVLLTPSSGLVLQYRSVPGGNVATPVTISGITAPYWVRLARYGNTLTGYRSANGTDWTQVGSIGVIMAANLTLGLAVTSHDTNKLNGTLFDHVSLGTPGFAVAVAPDSRTVTGGGGASFTVSVAAANSFNGLIGLSAAGLPQEASAAFSVPSVNGSGAATLVVTTSNTTLGGSYTLVITGTSGDLVESATVALNVTAADTDSDGVPDPWMVQYFGHPTGQAGDNSRPADDADKDGMSNRSEYLAGTKPTDPASNLKIIDLAAQGDRGWISWRAIGGKSYIVQEATAIGGPDGFTDISDRIEVLDEGESLTDFVVPGGATNNLNRFYRIRLEP